MKLKRQILDALDKAHDFALPETLVASEFDGIWKQLTQSLEQAGKTFADEGKNEDELKAEYRKIAERRVRLGLVIGEIGEKAKVQVSQDELRRALIEQARRYPGQEKFVYEYLREEPGGAGRAARADLRGQGGRPHPRAGQAGRQEGDGRGAAEARRGRATRTCTSATTMPTIIDHDHDHDHDHHDHDHDHGHDHGHDHDHDHDHGHDHDHDHDHDHGPEKK